MKQHVDTNDEASGCNESFSSVASFMCGLLEEKLKANSKGLTTRFDRMQVDIVDDNVKHYHSKVHHRLPRLPHQSLVTMRQQNSIRQLSRWATTFQPQHRSAPDLMHFSPRKELLERGTINTIPMPRRIVSPIWQSRCQEESHTWDKVTRREHCSMDNAVWSENDVRVSSKRTHRISELFKLSNLKLSPEREDMQIHGEPKKFLTEGTSNPLLVIEDILSNPNHDVEASVAAENKELSLHQGEVRLARIASSDAIPIIPRRWAERKEEGQYSPLQPVH